MTESLVRTNVDMLRRLVSERDLRKFFEQAAAEAARLVGADGGALIEVLDSGRMHYRFFQGLPDDHQTMLEGYTFEPENSTAGAALREGRPIFTANYPLHPNAIPSFTRSGLKANLVVPCGHAHDGGAVLALAWFTHYPDTPPDKGALSVIMLIADLMHAALYRQSLERDLARQAQHDTLTGLPNRRYLAAYLEARLSGGAVGRLGLVVAILDLDDFKPVNDRYGHFAGDQVLRQFAARLQKGVGANDLVARLGGDEFVLVMEPLVGEGGLGAFFERLCEMLDPFYTLDDGSQVACRGSIGVAVHHEVSDTPQRLLGDADRGLYFLKSRKAVRVERWGFYEYSSGEK